MRVEFQIKKKKQENIMIQTSYINLIEITLAH
jgi:hypothetical protein